MCVYFQLKHNYYCTKYYCSIHEENSLNYHRHICGSFRYKPNIILLHISIVWKLWYRLWGWCAVCKCVKYSLYSVYMSPASNRRFALQHFLTQKYNWNTQCLIFYPGLHLSVLVHRFLHRNLLTSLPTGVFRNLHSVEGMYVFHVSILT